MKKYYFKGTNQEIKLNGTVDEGTIKDLLKRNSIEVKDVIIKNVAPVQKKIVYRTHGKRGPMPKESNVKVINLNNEEGVNEVLNILTSIISGKY